MNWAGIQKQELVDSFWQDARDDLSRDKRELAMTVAVAASELC